jgi:hypothetical protein
LAAESPALVNVSDAARLRYALIVSAVGGLVALLVGALTALRRRPRLARQAASVDALHHNLARIGLKATEPYGLPSPAGTRCRRPAS